MCLQKKLFEDLAKAIKLNSLLGETKPLPGVEKVFDQIKSNEQYNLAEAEKTLARYKSMLSNLNALKKISINDSSNVQSPLPEIKATNLVTPIHEKLLTVDYLEPCELTEDTFSHRGLSARGKFRVLARHNTYRKRFSKLDEKVLKLEWSNELGERAQTWADYLARQNKDATHSGPLNNSLLGKLKYEHLENIANGSVRDDLCFTPESAVDCWYNEILLTSYKIPYPPSTGQTRQMIGHFMTLIARCVVAVGCGMAKNRSGNEFWVCQYQMDGKVAGESGKGYIDWERISSENWDLIRHQKTT